MEKAFIPDDCSVELAELFGILCGDGCVNYYPKKNSYMIDIAGNSLTDLEYHTDHICRLFYCLFGVHLRIYVHKHQNCIHSRILSKDILEFLSNKGICVGKKENLSVPAWILDDEVFFRAFIRGIFDTDGSVIVRSRNQHSLSLVLKSEMMIKNVKRFLEKEGYFVAYFRNDVIDIRGFHSVTHCIRINQKKLIKRFDSEIGLSNPYKNERLKKINGSSGI
jgi:intein/homing endonuclease